ncbi:hypothetical protein S83_051639 [Arachis hypogaea]
MEESRLIPANFDEDRIFYLHVDPEAVTHELPSLFYRKYRELLRDRIIVIDMNDNQIELSLSRRFLLATYSMDFIIWSHVTGSAMVAG